MKQRVYKTFTAYLWLTLASAVYALGFNWCYAPNLIGFGGITGVAQIIHSALPWAPIGTVVILLNIPLFLLGWRFIGGHLLVTSLYAMFVSSLMIDGMTALAGPFRPMEPLLACIYGGVILGVAVGGMLRYDTTTGGTELGARLLLPRFPHLPIGKICLVMDLAVIVSYAAVFGSVLNALYGGVALYLTTVVMDMVIYGGRAAKVAYIISDRHREISDAIIRDIDRGVTILHGEGAYSGAEKKVLLVAFKQRQIVAIKRLVKELDPAAFIIVCEAHEVLGDGFRDYKQNDI